MSGVFEEVGVVRLLALLDLGELVARVWLVVDVVWHRVRLDGEHLLKVLNAMRSQVVVALLVVAQVFSR